MLGTVVLMMVLEAVAAFLKQFWLKWPIIVLWALCFGILYMRGLRGFSK
jgi:predicted benzoate:H+ symporter BenE